MGQLARGHRLGKQRVVDPEVADVLRRLTVELSALRPRQDLAQPVGLELQRAGRRRHVGMRRKEVAEVRAPGNAEQSDCDQQAAHHVSRKGTVTWQLL